MPSNPYADPLQPIVTSAVLLDAQGNPLPIQTTAHKISTFSLAEWFVFPKILLPIALFAGVAYFMLLKPKRRRLQKRKRGLRK